MQAIQSPVASIAGAAAAAHVPLKNAPKAHIELPVQRAKKCYVSMAKPTNSSPSDLCKFISLQPLQNPYTS